MQRFYLDQIKPVLDNKDAVLTGLGAQDLAIASLVYSQLHQ